MNEFLRVGHPQLAEALDCLPVLPSGPIVDVLASMSAHLSGNAAGTRWTWIVMTDAVESPFALIEAISYIGRGFAPGRIKHDIAFRSHGELRAGTTISVSSHSKIQFRPRSLWIRSAYGVPWITVSMIRVGGRVRQEVYDEANFPLQIGTVLPWQVVTLQVAKSPRAPRSLDPFSCTMTGGAKAWTTHQVRETATLEGAIACARPESRAWLTAAVP